MTITIRPERPEDARGAGAVHRAAFPTDIEARLVALLRDSRQATVALVAEEAGEIVGHIVFSPVALDPGPALPGLGLAPVAVLPAQQRRGIGSQLIRAGLDACRDLGIDIDFVVVLGEPEYYQRFGFTRASTFGLGNEYGVDEPFMVIELRRGCLEGVQAVARYAPAFAMFAG